jgi:hypothetical protein
MEKYLDYKVGGLGGLPKVMARRLSKKPRAQNQVPQPERLPTPEKTKEKGCHQVLAEGPWEVKGILRVGLIKANDAKKRAVPDCAEWAGMCERRRGRGDVRGMRPNRGIAEQGVGRGTREKRRDKNRRGRAGE